MENEASPKIALEASAQLGQESEAAEVSNHAAAKPELPLNEAVASDAPAQVVEQSSPTKEQEQPIEEVQPTNTSLRTESVQTTDAEAFNQKTEASAVAGSRENVKPTVPNPPPEDVSSSVPAAATDKIKTSVPDTPIEDITAPAVDADAGASPQTVEFQALDAVAEGESKEEGGKPSKKAASKNKKSEENRISTILQKHRPSHITSIADPQELATHKPSLMVTSLKTSPASDKKTVERDRKSQDDERKLKEKVQEEQICAEADGDVTVPVKKKLLVDIFEDEDEVDLDVALSPQAVDTSYRIDKVPELYALLQDLPNIENIRLSSELDMESEEYVEESESETETEISKEGESEKEFVETETALSEVVSDAGVEQEDEDLLTKYVIEDVEFKEEKKLAELDTEILENTLQIEAERRRVKIHEEEAQQIEDTKRLEIEEMTKDTNDFLEDLIRSVTDYCELMDAKVVLRHKLDKVKLVENLVQTYKEYSMEKFVYEFLHRKIVEHFRRKHAFTPITKELDMSDTAVSEYLASLLKLDNALARKREAVRITSQKQQKTQEILDQKQRITDDTVRGFEQLVRHTLYGEKNPSDKFKELVETQFVKLARVRKEICETRSRLVMVEHTHATYIEQTKAMEDLGDGLKMQDFMHLQTEVMTLGKKVEERNFELNKWHSRLNNDLHIMAHMKEKLLMLRNLTVVQRSALDKLQEEHRICRAYVNGIRLSRNGLRKEIKDLGYDNGLIDKPDLLRDYDATMDRAEEVRGRVEKLKNQYEETQKKLAELSKSCGK